MLLFNLNFNTHFPIYRLRVDIVINAIAFFLLGMEVILSGIVCLNVFLASRKF